MAIWEMSGHMAFRIPIISARYLGVLLGHFEGFRGRLGELDTALFFIFCLPLN